MEDRSHTSLAEAPTASRPVTIDPPAPESTKVPEEVLRALAALRQPK